VLDQLDCVRPVSFWCISGLLNDVFVSGLPGLVGLSVHIHSGSRSLQYARALVCRSRTTFPVSWIFISKVSSPSSFSVLLRKLNSVSRLHKLYFQTAASSSSMPCLVFVAKWHVTLSLVFCPFVKIIIYNSLVCFWSQTLETYLKLNTI